MNSDQTNEEKLQRLLRLKRHEHPPEEFADEFLEKFQRRQRSEILRRSSLTVFRERLTEWLQGFRRPAILWGAAAVYGAIMLTVWLLPRPVPHGNPTILVGGSVVTENNVSDQPGHAGPRNISAPPNTIPGKRRTPSQEQDKEDIIGPDGSEKRDDGKLRDL